MAQVVQLAAHQNRRGAKAPSTSSLSRDEKLSRIILTAIEAELSACDFFTREDLLQLRVLQSVATITRYQMVCAAVTWLTYSRRLVSISRTELGLKFKKDLTYGADLVSKYAPTVRRLITNHSKNHPGPFDTLDLLQLWTSDPHLTTNAKRVVIRQTLKHLRKDLTLRDGPRHMQFISQGN